MAGKARNRRPLELSTCIDIGSLNLARQPKGWSERGKAIRATRLQHLRGTLAFAETSLKAEVGVTGGVVEIEHRGGNDLQIAQSVELGTFPMPRGGKRWHFVCPVTGGHARKLYLYPGSRQFCSRLGIDAPVTYSCQRDSGASRVMRQIWTLRRKEGFGGPLFGKFDQPDHMSDVEFLRYAARYLTLSNRLDFSTTGLKLKRTKIATPPGVLHGDEA